MRGVRFPAVAAVTCGIGMSNVSGWCQKLHIHKNSSQTSPRPLETSDGCFSTSPIQPWQREGVVILRFGPKRPRKTSKVYLEIFSVARVLAGQARARAAQTATSKIGMSTKRAPRHRPDLSGQPTDTLEQRQCRRDDEEA